MTDKELIKQEIERLKGKVDDVSSYSNGWQQALRMIEIFIDSLPEESGCEVNFTTKSEDLKEEIERWIKKKHFIFTEIDEIIETASHFAEWQKQNIKEALQTEYEKGRFDMQQEMMKDAVDGEVVYQIGSSVIAPTDIQYKVVSDRVYIPNVKLGDKVKIIICKTEQQ